VERPAYRSQRTADNDERAEDADEASRLCGRKEPLKGNPVRGSEAKQTHEVGRKETAEDVRNVEGGGRWAWKSIACLRTADVAKRVPSQPQGRRLASERADGEG
jgi:hypothetical protein